MTLPRKLAAELTGTAVLAMAVIGSGIMGERLAGGNVALALLVNTIATGGALVALILTFGWISGAHFNPLVTLAEFAAGNLPGGSAAGYALAQTAGAVAGAGAANVMFGLDVFSPATAERSGAGLWLGEIIATMGLVTVIRGTGRSRPDAVPVAVACYIVAAYWFTSSTSFANPALTLARSLTDSFAGIRPADVPAFLAAQLAGAATGAALMSWMLTPPAPAAEASRESSAAGACLRP